MNAEIVTDYEEELSTFTLPEETSNTHDHIFRSSNNNNYDQIDSSTVDEEKTSQYLYDSSTDDFFATLTGTTKNDPLFQQISTEELLFAEQSDSFCRNIRQRLQ